MSTSKAVFPVDRLDLAAWTGTLDTQTAILVTRVADVASEKVGRDLTVAETLQWLRREQAASGREAVTLPVALLADQMAGELLQQRCDELYSRELAPVAGSGGR